MRKPILSESAGLATTLALLALGFATVAWEWRQAHMVEPFHPTDPIHQQDAGGPEQIAPAREIQ